jgi:glutathione S-transferase
METSAEMFYLLKFYDRDDTFGFKDELERIDCLQWTFFWHGSGAPYQGQVNHFTRAAKEKIPCKPSLWTGLLECTDKCRCN